MIQNLQRILIKGGILSPSELKQIIIAAERMGLDAIYFGSRQDIIFPNVEGGKQLMEKTLPNIKLDKVTKREYTNIACSYVAAGIFPSTRWVSSVTYLYVIELFNYNPKLAINIVDPLQRIVPLFTGQLNFIASEQEDYWFLYIKLPNWTNMECYPVLIYTWDIANIAEAIENIYEDLDNVIELFEEVNNEIDTNNRTISKPLDVPFDAFPYYEGMNKMGIDQYWLGLYWRDNRYNLKFMKAMCDLCLACKIGKICLTPWKSFIVKGIPRKFKLQWEKLLGSFGINVRHSSLELNWHLPLADETALELKRYIIRNFDQNDISTYGLTFGVSSSYGANFTSIVIEKNPTPTIVQNFQIRPTYNVLYCENFNPNRLKYITYAQDVDKIELPGLLMELSQLYFQQLGELPVKPLTTLTKSRKKQENIAINQYQCTDCTTIYDSRYGDSLNNIPVGVPFEQLPLDYCCPVCDAPAVSFVAMGQAAISII